MLGCILVSQMNNYLTGFSNFKSKIMFCDSEVDLVNAFIQLVNNWDPEVICGYEVNLIEKMSV